MGERPQVLIHRIGWRVGDPDSRSRVTQAGRQEDLTSAEDGAEVPRRAVQHGIREPAVRAGDRLGEVHDVLVREQVQIGVQLRLVLEVHRAEAPPAAQVLGDGQGRPGPQRPEGHVTHDMDAEARDPGRARVFDPGVVVGSLPARIGGEDDAVASHPGRLAVAHQDLRDADPGHVSGGDQAG